MLVQFDINFYNNSLSDLLFSLGVFVFSCLSIWLIKKVVLSKQLKFKDADVNELLDNLLNKTNVFFKFVLCLYVACFFLNLPNKFSNILNKTALLFFLFQVGLWFQILIVFFINRGITAKANDPSSMKSTVSLMAFVVKLVLWSIILLLSLDNLGINITALIGSLGIGGIAVALAVQNILGDLFASLTIVLDKPFVVGDFVIVNEYLGTIEYIGLKTTRIRSLSGEQIIFPNADLLQSKIRNYKRMNQRRVVMNVGVVYETSHEKLQIIPQILEDIVKKDDRVRFDRAHFAKFLNFSLDFEIVYWVLSSDYNIYMDIQQRINLEIYKTFSEQGIQFAYPTQKVFVENNVAVN